MMSIKNFLMLLLLISFTLLPAQLRKKDYRDIMNSTSIYEIDAYLRDAHENEPKRFILKPRLIKMMKDYITDAHPADPRIKEFQEKIAILKRKPSTKITFEEMNAIIKKKQIAIYMAELNKKNSSKVVNNNIAYGGSANSGSSTNSEIASNTGNYEDTEVEEFKTLMTENAAEHKKKTVSVLNSLFDNDPNSKESAIVIENKSDCNIIMRIEGVGDANYKLGIPSKQQNTIVVAKGDYLFSSMVCGAQYSSQKTVQKAIIVSLSNPPK